MGERLATDVFHFAGVALHITRRDLEGGGSDSDEVVDLEALNPKP
jgi:hypothetical protein